MPRRRILSRIARPPSLAAGGFLLIGAAIVANALLLQTGRHPAPMLATRGSAKSSDAARPELRIVTATQEALRQAGFYSGPVDGVAGPQTIEAILDFERAAGRPQTGRASADLLTAIEAESRPAQAPLAPPAPDETVKLVQRALSQAAYGPVHADGVFGPRTGDAIVRFQRDHGLPTTGEISDALLVELRAAGALEDE